MITKRIIPCLDVKTGVLSRVSTLPACRIWPTRSRWRGTTTLPVQTSLFFTILRPALRARGLFTDILREVASQIFIPLTVGGGINTLDDFDRVLKCGADKVSVNSGAIRNPGIIPPAAQKIRQPVRGAFRRHQAGGRQIMLFAKGGRENTGMDALDWLEQGVKNGAGTGRKLH